MSEPQCPKRPCPRAGRYAIMPTSFWQLRPIHWHKLFVSGTLPPVVSSCKKWVCRTGARALPATNNAARSLVGCPQLESSVRSVPAWSAWPRPLAALGGRQWIHTHHRLPCPIVGIKPLPTNALALPLPPTLGATRSTPTPTINPPPLQVETAFCIVLSPLRASALQSFFTSFSRSALRGHFQAHWTTALPIRLPLTASNLTLTSPT